jgi:hypothetical protein
VSPAAQPIPQLPAPVPIGDTVGKRPKPKSSAATFLGGDASANAPSSPGATVGKTFLGQ